MSAATRALVTGLVLVTLLAAASVAGVLACAGHAARQRSLARLSAVPAVAARLREDRLALLRLRSDTLANDPSFVAYMAQSLMPNPAQSGAIDKASILDLLNQDRHGVDLAMVLDPDGRVAAYSGLTLARVRALQRDPMVKQVIASRNPASGVWVDDGRIVQVVVEPLQRAGALQGLLLTAQQLDDHFIDDVAGLGRSGVALLDASGASAHAPLVSAAAPWVGTALSRLQVPRNLPAAGHALRLTANGHERWGWISPVKTTAGTAALVAFPAPVAAPDIAPVWPLLLGVLVLALIGFTVVLWYWRRIALPMQTLAEIVERGAQGDHRLHARVEGSPDVRRLRDAVNRWFESDAAMDASRSRPRAQA